MRPGSLTGVRGDRAGMAGLHGGISNCSPGRRGGRGGVEKFRRRRNFWRPGALVGSPDEVFADYPMAVKLALGLGLGNWDTSHNSASFACPQRLGGITTRVSVFQRGLDARRQG